MLRFAKHLGDYLRDSVLGGPPEGVNMEKPIVISTSTNRLNRNAKDDRYK
jgi:hypothetical protein